MDTTSGFPSLDSYAEARKHFDSTKPWRSKYNPDNERPIGIRQVKLSGGRFKKAMRELGDGSIAFRLHYTDCVIWHPDGRVTVEGYATQMTNDFIGMLSPFRQGFRIDKDEYGRRSDTRDPVLYVGKIVVRCNRPVEFRLEGDEWVIDCDDLEPFDVPVVDRKAVREISAQYRLPEFELQAQAAVALLGVQHQSGGTFYDIANCLEKGDIGGAVELLPIGKEITSFGKDYGGPGQIEPGFFRRLRNWLYDHEGAVQTMRKFTLSRSAYHQYVADSKRFGY